MAVALALALVPLAAGAAEKSPAEIYAEYTARVVRSISFADDAAYYLARKRAEVIAFYPQVSRALAKCQVLSLAAQRLEAREAAAYLEYSATDRCTKAPAASAR
ncbi:hypothetical protein [Roseateles cavernae]|uniref:hypothetical protein n=1 Tax=Roseateles cavernae TaxID=3153578 RepID=UPI0032E4BD66